MQDTSHDKTSKSELSDPNKLRESYLTFMEKTGAKRVPSSSLLPENDPSTLFTGSGMQPMVPYLLGQPHPEGNEILNVQKCLRTVDIEEVGDHSHLTLFEMIGRWAFQADPATYKSEQVNAIWDWQVGTLGLDPNRLYISVYKGNKEMDIVRDDEAIETWKKLFASVGMDAKVEDEPWEYGVSRGGRIFVYDENENWWSRSGPPSNMPMGEPGGPDSEMFFDFDPDGDDKLHPAEGGARFVEIGNNVFMAYRREETGFEPIAKPNIDYGGGLERLASAVNGDPDIYNTAFFINPKKKIEELSGKKYEDFTREFRIILDHTRATTFLIGDGAPPSNTDAGYITRRLMRRAIRMARKIGIEKPFMASVSDVYIRESAAYPTLLENRDRILETVTAEEGKFQKTLQAGEQEMQKHIEQSGDVTGRDAFFFYETYGFPKELTEEFLAEHGKTMVEPEGYDKAAAEHSEKSRTASAGKFAGGLADHSEKTTALHSATHLMLAGLQEVVGKHVHQKGSNITPDRARFDFNNEDKLTAEQKKAVEDFVNAAIDADAKMTVEVMPKQQAMDEGVEGSFWEKYPDMVNVYLFKDATGKVWSRELCGGPHVEQTSDIGKFGRFKIEKEQSSSAGVRRVKAVLTEAVQEETNKKEASNKKTDDSSAAQHMEAHVNAFSDSDIKDISGVNFVGKVLAGFPAKDLKPMADDLKTKIGSGVVALVATDDGKASIVVGVTDDLTDKINAVDLVRIGSEALGGKGGGGRPDMAQAGGPNPDAANDAVGAIENGIAS